MIEYQYDCVVIGGGSGGLAFAKEAGALGKRVALLDYVTPSPQGSTWGLGGTCVNVGCIPKKLMHQASLMREAISDARSFGWSLPSHNDLQCHWETLTAGVQNHIGSLNWGYKVSLRDSKVTYINARGSLVDAHTVKATKRDGSEELLTGETVVVAVGGRPRLLGVPGERELCITSDDLFSLSRPPGKTLVVGASYIALECAGFLHALGFEVHLMVRSIFLRGFDQEMAQLVGEHMEERGVHMLRGCVPKSFDKDGDRIKVTYTNVGAGVESTRDYDTVLMAVGRDACTTDLGLEKAGVIFNADTGKIPAVNEVSNVPNIFALGDVLEGRQELTPVAIKAGIRLARRLYGGSTVQMNYQAVPTTVFSPLEYGCVGLSEEDAIAQYGEDNVEVYVSHLKPLEWQLNHEEDANGVPVRGEDKVYCKLITHVPDNERVIGVHYLGPHAGEIIQGLAIAMRAGATKADFDDTIGIHPTIAEEFTVMQVTKRSGQSTRKGGC